jgi:hypothetical protein
VRSSRQDSSFSETVSICISLSAEISIMRLWKSEGFPLKNQIASTDMLCHKIGLWQAKREQT